MVVEIEFDRGMFDFVNDDDEFGDVLLFYDDNVDDVEFEDV